MEQQEGKFPDEPIESEAEKLDTSILTPDDQARIGTLIKLGNISIGEATRRIVERRKRINGIALGQNISPQEAERRLIRSEEEGEINQKE